MKGSENSVSRFMSGVGSYLIPCYQRQYSWDEKQCRDLFDDMVRLYQQQREHDPTATHFIGSVVTQSSLEAPSSIMVIDGQQRLTTMYLFYLALYRLAYERAKTQVSGGVEGAIDYLSLAQTINITILADRSSYSMGASSKHRFTLTESDQPALDKLFVGNEDEFVADSRLTRNYRLFMDWISAQEDMSLAAFYRITESVIFIEIELDAKDDAQLIFESLNSKGLDLSEGDKVRNFLLMGFGSEEVKTHYRELWLPIETNCDHALSEFIKHFLALKQGRAPSQRSLYVNFKDYVQGLQHGSALSAQNQVKIAVLEELLAYSKLFARMRSCSYNLYSEHDTNLSSGARSQLQAALAQSLSHLKRLPYTVQSPVVLQAMMLHAKKQISGYELLEALQLLESFLFRRWACGCPSHGLNRMFQALALKLVPDDSGTFDLVRQFKLSMCTADGAKGTSSMPHDAEFVQALRQRALYDNSSRDTLTFMLERLENADSREQVKIDGGYSIEHIMPQKLTDEWRSELGADAEAIHKEWLHRLGNLTLTAYNSKYSNSSFAEKRTMEHGFVHSPLRLNWDIAEYNHWGPQEMAQRAETLIAKALKLWPYPGDSAGNRALAPAYVSKPASAFVAASTPAPTSVAAPIPAPASVSAPTHTPNLVPVPVPVPAPEIFDYCLAEGECDLTGTKLLGYEFMGQYYNAKSWAKLQRDVIAMLYQRNPERLRSWFKAPWGNFNWLAQYIKSSRDFAIDKDSPMSVYQLDEQLYFCTNQNVVTKLKLLKQLFELMQVDPAQLTIHLVRSKG